MGHPKFSEEDFLGAAQAIIAERGVSGVTVASVSERLGSPTGSFYHRFASRDVLLGSVWLRAVLDFQTGTSAALGANDGLKAALHTPAWVRMHPDQGRLLLVYDRKDFLRGEWPPELRKRVADMTKRMEAGSRRWAKAIFGREGREEIRLAQFLISELPVAVVRQHLLRGEPPPPLVDRIIRATYSAILADYRARKARPTRRGRSATTRQADAPAGFARGRTVPA
ncbi:MAG TPA: TetR/AcrR family transcriptional regulator [Vineibacter sp.]|nr:TetR/AcrR family transcriptional regulator [Vineibacter sp.]